MLRSICPTLVLTYLLATGANAETLSGKVEIGNKGLPASIELFVSQPDKEPTSLGSTESDGNGSFKLEFDAPTVRRGTVTYVVASSGDELQLMAATHGQLPKEIVISPLTTIGSIWPLNAFVSEGGISGPELGLQAGAMNVSNLSDVATGSWGNRIVDGINAWSGTSLARMNTLANLVSLCGTKGKEDGCSQFLTLTNANNTLQALSNIAKSPQTKASDLFNLSESQWPAPEGRERLSAPYVPYLQYPPSSYALMVRFAGAGLYSPGKLHIDTDGNIWSGQNWMPGSQSSVFAGIGGGTIKTDPAGNPLSPPITGYAGVAVDGIGWGTGISKNGVWVTGFDGRIGVYDFDGSPLVPETGAVIDGENGGLQGVGTSQNGDVWIADSTKDQMIYFPKGDPTSGRVVEVEGLAGPFGVVVDKNDRVWVSNSKGNTVTTFPSDDPSRAENITVGIGVRGIAADLDGNIWVVSNMTPGFPIAQIPDGSSIMDEFRISYLNLLKNEDKLPTGTLHMIAAKDGKWVATDYSSPAVNVPWGMTVDGNGNLWFGNFVGQGVVHICGVRTDTCPDGVKTGELIANYTSGVIELVTDAIVDSAGTVWAANNWNDGAVIAQTDKSEEKSTWGGGFGMVAIYGGLAGPVKTPLLGVVEPIK